MSCRFAVIGQPIAHSLSPLIHQYFAKQLNVTLTYEKITAEDHTFEQQVVDFFNHDGKGLNVTVPFKQRAYAMANQCTSRCKQAGAANTLWMQGDQLHADNTDGIGLMRDLSRYTCIRGKQVLILGAGGAARGIIQPLLENQPAQLVVAQRTLAKALKFQSAFPQITSQSLNEVIGPFDVVIHATSAHQIKEFMLPVQYLSTQPFCYDLSYKYQGRTAFVRFAKDRGCEAVDGLGMLVEQAAESFFIWHGLMPETKEILSFLRAAI